MPAGVRTATWNPTYTGIFPMRAACRNDAANRRRCQCHSCRCYCTLVIGPVCATLPRIKGTRSALILIERKSQHDLLSCPETSVLHAVPWLAGRRRLRSIPTILHRRAAAGLRAPRGSHQRGRAGGLLSQRSEGRHADDSPARAGGRWRQRHEMRDAVGDVADAHDDGHRLLGRPPRRHWQFVLGPRGRQERGVHSRPAVRQGRDREGANNL